MIAVFDNTGAINPLRFKICSDVESIVVKIDKVITVSPSRIAGKETLVYLCQSVIRGVVTQYEIKYSIGEHRWELYKM
jgi:hypothetical protein